MNHSPYPCLFRAVERLHTLWNLEHLPVDGGAHACRRGKTPLRYAVRGGHSMAAALLRAAGGVLLWREADAALRQVKHM